SRLMGHANASITLNVYSHLMPREHDPSWDRLASLVFGNKTETAGHVELRPDVDSVDNTRENRVLNVARGGIEPPTRGFSARAWVLGAY
ncbi:MAG: hypothetical protein ACREQD_07940, partial [Candidatus Binataceae bacterium]